MAYGLKRFQKAEALHFITFSCFHDSRRWQHPELKRLSRLYGGDESAAPGENLRLRVDA